MLIERGFDRAPLFAMARACEALVADTIVGNDERAGVLAREHLAEFPSDRLIDAIFPVP